MKRTISIILALVMLISALAITPVAAIEDTANTEYRDGYVLHNMDFTTGEITEYTQTGYSYFAAKTFTASNFDVNKDARYYQNGPITQSGDAYTDGKCMRAYYNNGGTNCGKRVMWFTNNGIPNYMTSYTVEFKVMAYTLSGDGNYFGLVWGDGTSMSAKTGVLMKFNNTIEAADYITSVYPSCTANSTNDTTTLSEITSAITGTQTADNPNWITFRVIVDGLTNNHSIQISCGNKTSTYISPARAQEGAYLGLLMADGLRLNIAHIRVIAGTDYENLIWPEGEEALVQSVGADACPLSVAANNDYSAWVQKANDKSKLRIVLAGKSATPAADKDITVKITYGTSGSVKTFTLDSSRIQAFEEVDASGRSFVAADGNYLFGVVITGMTDVMDSVTKVEVSYDTFNGSTNFGA